MNIYRKSTGCELLSNEYLCKRRNNFEQLELLSGLVVNCFQMSIFARGETTKFNGKYNGK